MTPTPPTPNLRGHASRVRGIVENFDHDDAYLIAQALDRESVMLAALDRQYPDVERRQHAKQLGELAATFLQANTARHFLETGK